MKKVVLSLICCFAISALSNTIYAEEGSETASEIIMHSLLKTNLRMNLDNSVLPSSKQKVWEDKKVQLNTMQPPGYKSVSKAVLFSATIPGAGQIYNGSYLRGALFMVIEAAALTGYAHFHSRGDDLESQFEAFANQYWEEPVYWTWISNISALEYNPADPAKMAALREFEHENFSHFLPEEKSQQYYENIGKYNQFVIGWNDFNQTNPNLTYDDYKHSVYNGQSLDTISEKRENYTLQRKDANDNFKRATNLITVAMLNHVFSALEAGLTTKRHNRRLLSTNFKFIGMYYNNEIIPAINLGLQW